MGATRKIAKNTSMLSISQIISYILIFFYTIYIARFFGADGFGTLSFALAFSGIFSIFADLGLNVLTVREVARNKSLTKKYIGNVLLIKIILAFLTFGLILLFVNLLNYPQETMIVVYLVSLSTILSSIFGIFYSIFQAYEKIEYQSLGQILSSLIVFFGVLWGISLGFDVIGFSLLYFASNAMILIYNFIIYFRKFSFPRIEYDKEFWKITIKESLPFGISGISGMIYTYIDSVMLSLIQGNEVVGWYNASYRLILVLLFIPTIINTVVFPRMSQYYNSSRTSLRLMNEKYFKFMLMIGFPLAIGVTLLANKLILLIFGQEYVQSIIALQILIWTIVFTFAGASFVQLLQSTNNQFVLTKISGICVIINVILNLIFIPKFSYIGASIATLITEIILVGYIIRANYNIGFGIKSDLIVKDISKILFSCLIMGSFIWYFKSLNIFILIILAILLYLGILYFIKGFDDVDIRIFREIIGT
jgi:O-antigen/teichoic acid export membrane protein